MTSIRWVCISDLHLGALNSLLTNVTSDGERVDGSVPSPVLTALGDCLRALRQPDQDPPQLIVLGDLFELALTAAGRRVRHLLPVHRDRASRAA